MVAVTYTHEADKSIFDTRLTTLDRVILLSSFCLFA